MQTQMNRIRALAIALCALAAGAAFGADIKTGMLAYQRGDFAAATRELRPLAESGDDLAQYLLGAALVNAKPPVLDLAEGEAWLLKSAARGNLAAMRDLGTLNAFVKPAPDRGQAERWLLAAADRGDTQAQHLLGVLYLDAKGAGRRPAAAYKWLMLAAERGHLLSALMLRVAAAQFSEEERKEGERLAAEWRPIR